MLNDQRVCSTMFNYVQLCSTLFNSESVAGTFWCPGNYFSRATGKYSSLKWMMVKGGVFIEKHRTECEIFELAMFDYQRVYHCSLLQLGYLTWVLNLFLDGYYMWLPTDNANGPPSSNCIIIVSPGAGAWYGGACHFDCFLLLDIQWMQRCHWTFSIFSRPSISIHLRHIPYTH